MNERRFQNTVRMLMVQTIKDHEWTDSSKLPNGTRAQCKRAYMNRRSA